MKNTTTAPTYTGHQTPPNPFYFDHDPTRLILRDQAATVDTHRLIMDGLTEAAEATQRAQPGRVFVWISYDMQTGHIITGETGPEKISPITYQQPTPLNSSRYLYITTTSRPMKPQEIADYIAISYELKDDLPF